eukprot:1162087-Pelagomonas_calceolata.AAC.6
MFSWCNTEIESSRPIKADKRQRHQQKNGLEGCAESLKLMPCAFITTPLSCTLCHAMWWNSQHSGSVDSSAFETVWRFFSAGQPSSSDSLVKRS